MKDFFRAKKRTTALPLRTVSESQGEQTYHFTPSSPGRLEAVECPTLKALKDEYDAANESDEVCECLIGFNDPETDSLDVAMWAPAQVDSQDGELFFLFADGTLKCKRCYAASQPVLVLQDTGDYRKSTPFRKWGSSALVDSSLLVMDAQPVAPYFKVMEVMSYNKKTGHELMDEITQSRHQVDLMTIPFILFGEDVLGQEGNDGDDDDDEVYDSDYADDDGDHKDDGDDSNNDSNEDDDVVPIRKTSRASSSSRVLESDDDEQSEPKDSAVEDELEQYEVGSYYTSCCDITNVPRAEAIETTRGARLSESAHAAPAGTCFRVEGKGPPHTQGTGSVCTLRCRMWTGKAFNYYDVLVEAACLDPTPAQKPRRDSSVALKFPSPPRPSMTFKASQLEEIYTPSDPVPAPDIDGATKGLIERALARGWFAQFEDQELTLHLQSKASNGTVTVAEYCQWQALLTLDRKATAAAYDAERQMRRSMRAELQRLHPAKTSSIIEISASLSRQVEVISSAGWTRTYCFDAVAAEDLGVSVTTLKQVRYRRDTVQLPNSTEYVAVRYVPTEWLPNEILVINDLSPSQPSFTNAGRVISTENGATFGRPRTVTNDAGVHVTRLFFGKSQVSRLILIYFFPSVDPTGRQGDHRSNNAMDNRLGNLQLLLAGAHQVKGRGDVG